MQSFGQSYCKHKKLTQFNSEWTCAHNRNPDELLKSKRDSTSDAVTP